MRWLKRLWWRICDLCPRCGEVLVLSGGRFSDCYGCGYWRDESSGYESVPQVNR